MIKMIFDDNKTIMVNRLTDLSGDNLKEIFKEDPNPDVMVTYVISSQPTSRREHIYEVGTDL